MEGFFTPKTSVSLFTTGWYSPPWSNLDNLAPAASLKWCIRKRDGRVYREILLQHRSHISLHLDLQSFKRQSFNDHILPYICKHHRNGAFNPGGNNGAILSGILCSGKHCRDCRKNCPETTRQFTNIKKSFLKCKLILLCLSFSFTQFLTLNHVFSQSFVKSSF